MPRFATAEATLPPAAFFHAVIRFILRYVDATPYFAS